MSNDGIWGHSAPAQEHVIFSIDLPKDEGGFVDLAQVMTVTTQFKKFLDEHNIPLIFCIGKYTMDDGEAVSEPSFVVRGDQLHLIHEAGWITNQESVLVLGKHDARDRRQATLTFPDGRNDVDLGWFGSIRQEDLGDRDFTYNPAQNKFYTCMSRDEWDELNGTPKGENNGES